MAIHIKAPGEIGYPIYNNSLPGCFLAGSIDMGNTRNWQEEAFQALSQLNVNVFNPRREEWDATWVQTMANPDFRDQVWWESTRIEASKYILFHFEAESKAPISFYELGRVIANKEKQVIVSCAPEFYRHGNIEIECQIHNRPIYSTLQLALAALVLTIKQHGTHHPANAAGIV